MSQIRKISMFGGTFAVALGIGFVMQNGDALAARFGTEDELRAAQAEVQARTETEQFIILDALAEGQAATDDTAEVFDSARADTATLSPTLPDLATPQAASAVGPLPVLDAFPRRMDPPIQLAAAEPDLLPGDVPATDAPGLGMTVDIAAGPLDCTTSLSADLSDAAMVDLTLVAPCSIDSRVTIHHQGVMFTMTTDSDGTAEVTVPALAENAIFIADIVGSDGAMAMVQVPEIASYDRAVLQWQGDAGLELHAREFGAEYGSAGHIWNGHPRDMATAIETGEGFLVRLGDPAAEEALMAEVYTFPTGTTAKSGAVLLSAEIEIGTANCGREVAAQSLQMGPDRENSALDLTLTLPGCDASGDFLVLQNMFEDLTLAAK